MLLYGKVNQAACKALWRDVGRWQSDGNVEQRAAAMHQTKGNPKKKGLRNGTGGKNLSRALIVPVALGVTSETKWELMLRQKKRVCP